MIWILVVAAGLTGLAAYQVHRQTNTLRGDIRFHEAELQRDESRRNAEQVVLRALTEAARTNEVIRNLVSRHGIRPLPAKRLRDESP